MKLLYGEIEAKAKRGAVLLKVGDIRGAKALYKDRVIFEVKIFIAKPYISL